MYNAHGQNLLCYYGQNNPIRRNRRAQEYKFDYNNDNLIYMDGQVYTRGSLLEFKLPELKGMFPDTKDFARVKKARRQAQIKQAVTIWRLRKVKEYLLKEKRELENEIEELRIGNMNEFINMHDSY